MKALLTSFACALIAVPVLAGPPVNGIYTSTDIGGTMLPGRYSESWFPGPLVTNNTLNEESWDGSALGTQWRWYCPWIAAAPALQSDNVDGFGNGQKVWKVTYAGGYCWLDGAGPWAGGDASYTASITLWLATVTETYANFQEVGTVRNQSAQAMFDGYNEQCMSIAISNAEKLGDTDDGPLPANYPDFWDWVGCANIGTAGPGEWGDVDSITYVIFGCETVATQEKTWGAVKAIYRE
jgi:hypothetical protein